MTNEEIKSIRCPHCGTEIDRLINVQSGNMTWNVELFKDELTFDDSEFFNDDVRNNFECPNCNHVIAENEEDAIKILKGIPLKEE